MLHFSGSGARCASRWGRTAATTQPQLPCSAVHSAAAVFSNPGPAAKPASTPAREALSAPHGRRDPRVDSRPHHIPAKPHLAATRRCWPNAVDLQYPTYRALKREMTQLLAGVLSGRRPEQALFRLVELWTVYQRGPYKPYASTPFSAAVATYARLQLHMLALQLYLRFPQVRWKFGLVWPAVKSAAVGLGNVEAMMAVLRQQEALGAGIGLGDLEQLAVACIRGEEFSRARTVLQQLEAVPDYRISARLLLEVVRSALALRDVERAARAAAAIAPAIARKAQGHLRGMEAREAASTASRNRCLQQHLRGYLGELGRTLAACVEGGDAASAFAVLRSLVAIGYTPEWPVLQRVLVLAMKAPHPGLAELGVACWAAWAAPIDATAHRVLLHAYARAGDVTGALRVLQLAHHFAGAGSGVEGVLDGEVGEQLVSALAEVKASVYMARRDAESKGGAAGTAAASAQAIGLGSARAEALEAPRQTDGAGGGALLSAQSSIRGPLTSASAVRSLLGFGALAGGQGGAAAAAAGGDAAALQLQQQGDGSDAGTGGVEAEASPAPSPVPPHLHFLFPELRRNRWPLLRELAVRAGSGPGGDDAVVSYLLYCHVAAAEEAASLGPDWAGRLLRHWEAVGSMVTGVPHLPRALLNLTGSSSSAPPAPGTAPVESAPPAAASAATAGSILAALRPATLRSLPWSEAGRRATALRGQEGLAGSEGEGAAAAAVDAAAATGACAVLTSPACPLPLDIACTSLSDLLSEARDRGGVSVDAAMRPFAELVPVYEGRAREAVNAPGQALALRAAEAADAATPAAAPASRAAALSGEAEAEEAAHRRRRSRAGDGLGGDSAGDGGGSVDLWAAAFSGQRDVSLPPLPPPVPGLDPAAAIAGPVWGLLLEALPRARLAKQSIPLLPVLMRHTGCRPGPALYASLLATAALPPFAQLEGGQGVLSALQGQGLQPDGRVFGQMAVLLARLGRIDRALGVAERAAQAGQAPPQACLMTIVRCAVLAATGELPRYDAPEGEEGEGVGGGRGDRSRRWDAPPTPYEATASASPSGAQHLSPAAVEVAKGHVERVLALLQQPQPQLAAPRSQQARPPGGPFGGSGSAVDGMRAPGDGQSSASASPSASPSPSASFHRLVSEYAARTLAVPVGSSPAAPDLPAWASAGGAGGGSWGASEGGVERRAAWWKQQQAQQGQGRAHAGLGGPAAGSSGPAAGGTAPRPDAAAARSPLQQQSGSSQQVAAQAGRRAGAASVAVDMPPLR